MKNLILLGVFLILFTCCEHWHTIEIRNELDCYVDIAMLMEETDEWRGLKDTIIECIVYNDCRFTIFKSDDKSETCGFNYCDSLKIGLDNEFLFKIPPFYSLKYIGDMNESPFDILSRISEIDASYPNGIISAKNDGVIQLFSVREDSYFSMKRVWILKW
jgi:hypothetical protein